VKECRARSTWYVALAAALLAAAFGSFDTRTARAFGGNPSIPLTNPPSRSTHTDPLPPDADEISVSLSLSKVGTTVVPAIIVNQDVYIPIMGVLDFVKVKSELTPDRNKITGFFIDESETYTIDLVDRSIKKGISHLVLTSKEILETSSGTYLRSDLYKKVFGIDCVFNFNLLDVKLSCDRELPAVTEALRKKNSSNIAIQNGAISLQRNFPLQRSLFTAGALDWSISSSLTRGVHAESYYFALGTDLLGGDFDARLSGSPQVPMPLSLAEHELLWRWRYVMPESKVLSQIYLGTISSMATTALADSVVGIQITNKALQTSSNFATYNIRDRTEPGWGVELYINNVLIKSTTADAGGNYQFAVPLSYGATSVTLKFYGPWGEVLTKDMELRIPYTFLPPGKFEYSLTAGTNKTNLNFKENVAQFNLDAGVNTWLSVGGGVKYDKEPGFSPYAPFASVSTQLLNSVLLNGQYIDGSGLQGHLSYTAPFGLSVDGLYNHPFAHQRFGGLVSANDSRSLTLSAPLSAIDGSAALTSQDVQLMPGLAALTSSLILNGQVNFIPITLTTNASYQRAGIHLNNSTYTGSLAFYVVGPFGFLIKPQCDFEYTGRRFTLAGATFQRGFGTGGQFQLSLNEDLINMKFGAQVDFRYSFPWAQVGTSEAVSSGIPTYGASAQGSIIFDGSSREVVLSDRSFVDHGGIMIRPFLDLNNNGYYDFGEPIVKNFKVGISGGRVIHEDNGIVRVMDLDPYVSYVLKNSTESVENLAWVSKFENYSVMVDANSFRPVNIPITVAGQIGGYVRLVSKDGPDGQGGIKMKVRDRFGDQKEIPMPDDFLTYSTGEYYNIGLTPGKYQIYPDKDQLKQLRLKADPPYINFELKNSVEGDIIDTLNFLLRIDGGPDTTSGPATSNRSPASAPRLAPHQTLKDLGLGMPADKALDKLNKPKDLLAHIPLVAGRRAIVDTFFVGDCALPMQRTITFDDKNLLQEIGLAFHGKDYSKIANQDCVLYWLTDQYGYPQVTTVEDGEKQYRWQIGYTQLNLKLHKRTAVDYDIGVSYIKTSTK